MKAAKYEIPLLLQLALEEPDSGWGML